MKCVKSVLGEFSSGVSICRNNGTQSDFGALFLPGPPLPGGTGALPPALVTTDPLRANIMLIWLTVKISLTRLLQCNRMSEVRDPHCIWLAAWAQCGGEHGGRVPPLFQGGGYNMPCPPHFFLFRFCIWRGFKNKSDVCHVLCEELFMLEGRLRIAKFMLKQSLMWYHWFC